VQRDSETHSPVYYPAAVRANPMSFDLTASFAMTVTQDLQIHWTFANRDRRDVYLFDRLWVPANKGRTNVADSQQAYRFVGQGRLRLVLGAAPLPTTYSLNSGNTPYATLVPSGTELKREIFIPAPVREYSVYFPHTDKCKYESVRVAWAELVCEFVWAEPEWKTLPAPFDKRALFIRVPGIGSYAKPIWSEAGILDLEVSRRTDEFERGLYAYR
jgi:hypothetical protein